MKKKCLFIIILSMLYFQGIVKAQNERTGKYLFIQYVDFSSLPIVAISCENFEKYTESLRETKIIHNNKAIGKLNSFIIKSKYRRKNEVVDIKAKIRYMIDSNEVNVICMGNFNEILINGRVIQKNIKFAHFLLSLFLPQTGNVPKEK